MEKAVKSVTSTPVDNTVDDLVKKFKKHYEMTISKIKEEYEKKIEIQKDEKSKENKKYICIALIEAERAMTFVKIAHVSHEKFKTMNDVEKINYVSQEFKEFSNQFPIVFRWMVCMGQYSRVAFLRFLNLTEMKLRNATTKQGETEDKWIHCNANYVRYLWEHIQDNTGKRYTAFESNKIYQQAYECIKKDFNQFRKIHKEAEEKAIRDRQRHKMELVRELISSIKDSNLQSDEFKKLEIDIKSIKCKQDFNAVLQQVKNRDKTPANYIGNGSNVEEGKKYIEEFRLNKVKKTYTKI